MLDEIFVSVSQVTTTLALLDRLGRAGKSPFFQPDTVSVRLEIVEEF